MNNEMRTIAVYIFVYKLRKPSQISVTISVFRSKFQTQDLPHTKLS